MHIAGYSVKKMIDKITFVRKVILEMTQQLHYMCTAFSLKHPFVLAKESIPDY